MSFHELSPGFVGINVAVISFEKKKKKFLDDNVRCNFNS